VPRLALVSGPAGSGKSRWAEHLAATSGLAVTYFATGPLLPDDPSWQRRLERHRRRRPAHWGTREVGPRLAEALRLLGEGELGLVDSLGTWVAAHLELEREAWDRSCDELVRCIARCRAPLVVVCEEVGWGVVPPTPAGHRFRERLAALQRRLAGRCEATWLVLQGRAIDLQRVGLPVPVEEPPADGAGEGRGAL
jgi:adenosylcobinamide kinase/adenosylcobinamide-phosphate guanylyltransferase